MARTGSLKPPPLGWELWRPLVSVILVTALLAPLVIVIAKISVQPPTWDRQIFEVLFLTLVQASLSASVSIALGFLGALGLNAIRARWGAKTAGITEIVALVPNAVPVLLVLLAVMKLTPAARGWWGIIFVHAVLNVGAVSVVLARVLRSQFLRLSELAVIEGCGRLRFIRRALLPLLKGDFARLFLYVFAFCFSSFAVPLALGGSRATTLEVLIYQRLRISADWSGAVGLTILQMVSVFVLALILSSRENAVPPDNPEGRLTLLAWFPGSLFALGPSLLVILGFFDGAFEGARGLLAPGSPMKDKLLFLFSGSIVIGFGAGAMVLLLLYAIAYAQPTGLLRRFLLGYVAPSSALVGFAILVAWRELGWASYLKIILGVTLVTIPALYRFYWDSKLQALSGQITIARTLGAGAGLIFWRVVAPQVTTTAFLLAGLASLWAWGDFALSSIIAERSLTLAMATQTLMNSYRLEMATFMAWLVAFGGLISFGLFTGAAYVLGSKSEA